MSAPERWWGARRPASTTVVQVVVGLVASLILLYLARRVLADLRANGLAPGFDFLSNTAGFAISEGLRYVEGSDSYGWAFVVGLWNTLRVAIAGIVLATPLGLMVALGRLSGNPLVERLAGGYVELMRNTPLLVQLFFWYQAVFLRLPGFREAVRWRPPVPSQPTDDSSAWLILSQRGVALPGPQWTEHALQWLILALGCGAIVFTAGAVGRRLRRDDGPSRVARPIAATAIGLWVLLTVWRPPLQGWTLPTAGRFGYETGLVLSPELSALLVGLVVYTAAFIAEVIRGGIQSVSRGQREAARAVALSEAQSMRLIVLPQALRVIVPPLTNQYLNLTKNSSLAIFIGYPDLFNVGLTIGNNTGQFVVITAMMMAVYLTLSLTTSLIMNVYDRRIQLVER